MMCATELGPFAMEMNDDRQKRTIPSNEMKLNKVIENLLKEVQNVVANHIINHII